jgi:outer membrane protein assembly factor BamB
MKISHKAAIIAFFLFFTCSLFSQKHQFLENNIFYTNGYFIELDSLLIKKQLSGEQTCYGQDDKYVFTGNGNNIFSWDKSTLEQSPAFDTALFYDISVTSYGFNWNVVYLRGKKFSLDSKKNKIIIHDISNNRLSEISDIYSEFKRNINGRDLLFKSEGSIIHVKDLESEYGYLISSYDENGKEFYSKQLHHTKIEITGNTHHHERILNYLTHNSKYVIFTTSVFSREFSQTAILELATGNLTEIPISTDGVLFDREDKITGLFQYDGESKEITFYDKLSDDLLWKYKYNYDIVYNPSVTALFQGNILVLALYHSISTGSDLLALDINTGKLLWHANVEQVNASHSEYYNTVNLYAYKDKVLMEGIESYGKYLQVFDINTGATLYSDLYTY